MNNSYYLIATALAALLMVVEHEAGKARGIEAYRFSDTLGNLSNHFGELVLTAVLSLNVFTGYEILERHVGLFEWPTDSWTTWALGLFVIDGVYYLGHRLCHRVALLWALHAVHHQSRELNIGVGLRGPWLSALQIAPFMVPIAVLGLPSSVLFPLYAGHTVWKLLVHTRLVGKLGVLERVLATPSQHRVHHAVNERYVDRNFGGLFSIWDRLFETFQVEDEAPRFGEGPARTELDALSNNLDPWRELVAAARLAPGRLGWLRVLFAPPTAPTFVPVERAPDVAATPGRLGAAVRLVAVATVAMGLLMFGTELPLAVTLGAGVCAILALSSRRPARAASAITPQRAAP